MHKSAYEIGKKFLDRYWQPGMEKILEVGALDVNGSLRDFQPKDSDWIGVDLEAGKGVDVVVERSTKLPFEDNTFDLILATSAFEHDSMFWMTFNEMLRVVKDGGFIYICAPSNGWVHRYPLDVYRFYPDAGVALEEWGKLTRSNLKLQESFISERDGDIWNDFCAIFSLSETSHQNKVYLDTPATNIWDESTFLESSLSEATEDMRKISELSEKYIFAIQASGEMSQRENDLQENVGKLTTQLDTIERADSALQKNMIMLNSRIQALESEKAVLEAETDVLTLQLQELASSNRVLINSKSWRITAPLRALKSSLLRIRGKK